MAGGDAPAKKSDLGVRTLSAIVMVAIAGTALWLRGWVWTAFVVAVAAAVYWEWTRLYLAFSRSAIARSLWGAGGIIYVSAAAGMMVYLNSGRFAGQITVLLPICAVMATDIGAYFAGRAIGGPKIAPRVSPSKTWAGLFGGILGASVVMLLLPWCYDCEEMPLLWRLSVALLGGCLFACVAQAGDFFESWMKRRAGVKDSSNLIPGHGGLFDRVDGLLAVFAAGAAAFALDWLVSGQL